MCHSQGVFIQHRLLAAGIHDCFPHCSILTDNTSLELI